MLLQNKKIAIIGAGPGGLTLARLLQLQGANIKVYERDIDKHARVQGSPLDLHKDSGIAALQKANLLDEFKKNILLGADKTIIVNEMAQIFLSDHESKNVQNFGDAHFRPEIDRGALRRILIDSLQKNTIEWDSHFIQMEKHKQGWLLHFKNKQEYADIVIAADGANSKIRPYITDIRPFYSGITMLEGIVYEGGKSAPQITALLHGGKVMAFGNNKNILMGQKANGEFGFYFSFRANENWVSDSGLNFNDKAELQEWFKKEYAEWSSIWYELIDKAALPIIPRPIYCMPLNQTWEASPNLTMLGDAAHLMPPFAGEGVNMAMLDALELAECLTYDKYSTYKEAFCIYELNMRKRAALIARESLENGDKMHSENALKTMLEFFKGN